MVWRSEDALQLFAGLCFLCARSCCRSRFYYLGYPAAMVGILLSFLTMRMKTLATTAGSLAFAALLPALAQTPATTHDNPTPATPHPRSATKHKSAPGAAASRAVGQKFIEKSKPDTHPIRVQPRPVKTE